MAEKQEERKAAKSKELFPKQLETMLAIKKLTYEHMYTMAKVCVMALLSPRATYDSLHCIESMRLG